MCTVSRMHDEKFGGSGGGDKYDRYAEKFPPPVEKYMGGGSRAREPPGDRGPPDRGPPDRGPGYGEKQCSVGNRGYSWADTWSRKAL